MLSKLTKVACLFTLAFSLALTGSAFADAAKQGSGGEDFSGLARSAQILEEASLRYYVEPKEPPTYTPPVIPIMPLTPEEMQQIIDFLNSLLKSWTWQQILDRFDTDHDGKLSGEELRRFLEAVMPCSNQVTCAIRDALIEKYLKRLLCGARPDCDYLQKKISLDDVLAWIDSWIRIYTRQLNNLNCNVGTPEQRAECERRKAELQKLIDELKKLRDKLKPPAPAAPAPNAPAEPAAPAQSGNSTGGTPEF